MKVYIFDSMQQLMLRYDNFSVMKVNGTRKLNFYDVKKSF